MANASTKTHYIPAGYHSVTPYIIVRNAARALDWYKNVFGAQEELRFPMPDGKIGHAEIKIGDSHKAVAGGAKVKQELQDKFYGDRNATFYDPFGHQWTIATHVEDVSPEEMQRRASSQK
jgi:PhnB protein